MLIYNKEQYREEFVSIGAMGKFVRNLPRVETWMRRSNYQVEVFAGESVPSIENIV